MTNRCTAVLRGAALLVLLTIFIPGVIAQGFFGVLSDVDVERAPQGTRIRIGLNLPMRYAGHSPAKSGKIVQIELQVVSTAELDTEILHGRQTIAWTKPDIVPLQDVVYEGNVPGRPSIVLSFSRDVQYLIQGGKDFRSIEVTILPDEGAFEPSPSGTTSESGAPPPAVVAPSTPQPTSPPSRVQADRGAPAAPPTSPRLPGPAASEGAARDVPAFVINLASARRPFDLARTPHPAVIEGYRLYTTPVELQGVLWHRLRLGFFNDRRSAEQIANSLQREYPQAWVTTASIEERAAFAAPEAPRAGAAAPSTAVAGDERVARDTTARQTPSPAPSPTPASEAEIASLMDEARIAMTGGDYARAILLYTKVLQSPQSSFAPEAQELLGLARERNGQLAHAKAEYEIYLQRYPDGEGADRVRQRLAGLVTATAVAREPLGETRATREEARWDVFGSFSQFFRFNELDIEGRPSTTTQNALFSDLTATARRRSRDLDLRARFTGGYDLDFLDSSESEGRVSELYLDSSYRPGGASARIGRQNRSSGGVLGRFDGGLFGYRFTSMLQGNVVLGYPVASTDDGVETNRHFYGADLNLGTFADRWDFDVFYIKQEIDGIDDREAVGGELRYFEPRGSVFSLLDYDISFNDLNILLVVGTWTFPDKTTINVNFDYRNSPTLTTSNALLGQPVMSIDELSRTFTESELRQLAEDRTAHVSTLTVGASRPLNEQFQLSGDITATKQESTPASGGVPATPGTDWQFLYFLQIAGSSLLKSGDIGILGFRYSDLDASDVYTLSLNSRYPVTGNFRINPRFDWIFRDNKLDDSERTTLRPFLRLEYTWRRQMRFEAELGAELIEDDTATDSISTRNYFANIGYRIDF